MKECPACGANAGKELTGLLGESNGVWCTSCGHKLDSVKAWEDAHRGDPNQVWGAPKPDPSYTPPKDSAARKLFHERSRGPLNHICRGLDVLPLVDVAQIPDDQLANVLFYLYNEVWTTNTPPQQMRDRLKEKLNG